MVSLARRVRVVRSHRSIVRRPTGLLLQDYACLPGSQKSALVVRRVLRGLQQRDAPLDNGPGSQRRVIW